MAEQFNRSATLIITLTNEFVIATDLRIDFVVYKSAESEPDTAAISVYNFTETNRNKLQNQYESLKLSVGYPENIAQIFEGDILNIITRREGPDIITQFFARDSAVSYDFGYTNRSYTKNFNLFGLLSDLATDLTRDLVIQGVEDKTFQYGKSYEGATRTILSRLENDNNFFWFLTPTTLFIVKEGASIPDRVFSISPATGMVNIPKVTERGTDVDMLLNPQLLPARLIEITSETISSTVGRAKREVLAPELLTGSGTFRILTITHRGSTYINTWLSHVVTERFPAIGVTNVNN